MSDQAMRQQLAKFLSGEGAHPTYETVLVSYPVEIVGSRVPAVTNTPWRLLEHLRIAQWDILEFCRNPDHVSPEFPRGYWPETDGPAHPSQWRETADAFLRDLKTMREYVLDPTTDLFAPIPHGDGQTVFREALLVVDHNAYHFGQMVILEKALAREKR